MTTRRKILFLIPSLDGGGAERVFSVLLSHLDRSRFELHLAVLQARGAYLRDIPDDVAIYDLKISRVRNALPGIVRLVWKIRPQSVISTLWHLNFVLIVAKSFLPRKTKVLLREAGTVSSIFQEDFTHPGFWRWLYRCLYRRADTIVCLSDSMKNDMIANLGLPSANLVRIYNPVDTAKVRAAAETGMNPYSEPGPNLVAAGRFTREKGFDVLLDAMNTVNKLLPSVRLTILGDGPLRAELADQAQRLGLSKIVAFPGFQ